MRTLLALPVMLLLAAAPARAAISCTTSMTALNFSAVNPLSSLTNATATLNYTCTNGGWFARDRTAMLCFSIGEPAGGPTNPRLMHSGGNTLQFQLFQDASRTTIWGSQFFGSPTPLQVQISIPANRTRSGSATLYGQVLGGQTNAIPNAIPDEYWSNYTGVDTALTINQTTGNTPPSNCGLTQENAEFPFRVSAAVTKQCTVSAGAASDIDLGSVAASGTNITGNGSIRITCSNTTPYYVGLLPSNGDTAGAGLMSATGGNTDKVPYQLYQNAGLSTIWGNTATATSAGNGVAGTGNGAAKSHTVYVRAPSADFTPGEYSDTVTVNVHY